MGLESASVVDDLVTSNPLGSDNESQGDDHIRLLKAVLKTTFPRSGRPYAFPATSAEVSGNVTLAEGTHGQKLIPVNASAAARTITLPSDPQDGWAVEIQKVDSRSNAVIVTGAQSIHGATSIAFSSERMTARFQYNDAAGYWHLGFRTPGVPYFPGGPALSVDELGSKGTSQRIMAQGVSGSAWSSYYLGQVLDFLGTSPGDILHRGNTGWERLPASSNSMHVLKSQGAASPILWGLHVQPAHVYTSSNVQLSTASTIPLDTSIPQIGEGLQVLSASIVPVKPSSRIRAVFDGFHANLTGNGGNVTFALFRNGGADAVAANVTNHGADGSPKTNNLVFEYAPGVSGNISFRVNFGPAANTAVLNSNAGTSIFGGVATYSLTLDEIFTE